MRHFLIMLLIVGALPLSAQKTKQFSFALTNNASAYPYAIFARYFSEPVHPGFEAGWHKTLKQKKKHDWFRDVKIGYFYHRFIQHGIPLYVNYGYRYKFTGSFCADAALGAGYFHSIPATEVLKKDDNGNYTNAKGIGRPQAIVAFTLGTGYTFKLKEQPLKLFLHYQVRLQTPFVKSYVPILPYNQVAFGTVFNFKTGKK